MATYVIVRVLNNPDLIQCTDQTETIVLRIITDVWCKGSGDKGMNVVKVRGGRCGTSIFFVHEAKNLLKINICKWLYINHNSHAGYMHKPNPSLFIYYLGAEWSTPQQEGEDNIFTGSDWGLCWKRAKKSLAQLNLCVYSMKFKYNSQSLLWRTSTHSLLKSKKINSCKGTKMTPHWDSLQELCLRFVLRPLSQYCLWQENLINNCVSRVLEEELNWQGVKPSFKECTMSRSLRRRTLRQTKGGDFIESSITLKYPPAGIVDMGE